MKSLIVFSYVISVILITGLSGFADTKTKLGGKESESKESTSKEEPSSEVGVIINSAGMKLKLIEAGELIIKQRVGNYMLEHKLSITKPFYIGVYEVTQEQYEKIMGKNPAHFKGPNRPVESIRWDDVLLFCKKLSEKEGVEYRLPTQKEWEYACRAGTKTRFYWGNKMDGDYAWYRKNSEKQTHDVGQKKSNPWGLYDMSGNVSEWCSDWSADKYYPEGSKEPAEMKNLTYLGGSFYENECPSTFAGLLGYREGGAYKPKDIGFRVVREVK